MLHNLPLLGRLFPTSTPAPADTLTHASVGQPLRLCHINADKPVTHRLTELGLTAGVELNVIHAASGTLLIAVRGSRVALGRETAATIHVEPI